MSLPKSRDPASGLAHRASGLMAAYVVTLGVLAARQRMLVKRQHQAGARTEPSAEAPADYSKREGSPAPTRATTGTPSEKSTTVVGSEPHSPESITASNQ